ncbi:MAG: hypothetical protein C0169_07440 [Thermodesulfobacterium geofontis]|uniref:Uncharacterized protein n=1 Tax=Thermodesulfobacterium geofontis TaxID=1295609 RepID=A0A2N7Q6P1_9BACT|nr:MAG: hypothetical protein C0169_07440 [Thermodesulfobacterium geofontis]
MKKLKVVFLFPEPRFEVIGEIIFDNLTGLFWTKKADLGPGLVTWDEAFEIIMSLIEKNF